MRGLAGRCPRCGKGRLFHGFLTLRPRCEACGLDYSFADSADGPAFFVMFFAGFIVAGSALAVEVLYAAAVIGCMRVLWMPLILLTTLGAAAADEGSADRPAVPSQGRRRPFRRRRRAVSHDVGGAAACEPACSLPPVFALVALVTFIGLGTWQLQRKAWKEALIATLDAAPGGDVRPSCRRASAGRALIHADDEFRRVKFSAALLPGQEALVYGSGSALRERCAGHRATGCSRRPGLPDGGLVVVNRGFVPEGRQDQEPRRAGDVGGLSRSPA